MVEELCGVKTPNGPCTMPKDHDAEWHRHREYDTIFWRISINDEVFKFGSGRVPLNYALTEALSKSDNATIEIEGMRSGRPTAASERRQDRPRLDQKPFTKRSSPAPARVEWDAPSRRCAACLNEFKPFTVDQEYCSPKCFSLAYTGIDAHLGICLWCAKEIPEGKRAHSLYCSPKCRIAAFRAAECLYCGMPADSRDHFVPRSYVASMESIRVPDFADEVVPCCLECNSTAGDKVFDTIAEKRDYIHSQYKIKYKKLLDSPNWEEDELGELGHTLKTRIVAYNNARSKLLLRLAWGT